MFNVEKRRYSGTDIIDKEKCQYLLQFMLCYKEYFAIFYVITGTNLCLYIVLSY